MEIRIRSSQGTVGVEILISTTMVIPFQIAMVPFAHTWGKRAMHQDAAVAELALAEPVRCLVSVIIQVQPDVLAIWIVATVVTPAKVESAV